MPTALITGITGQDGSYLAEHLLIEGLRGLRPHPRADQPQAPASSTQRCPTCEIELGDLLDQASLIAAVEKVQPDEVYNLAAISFVPLSWNQPELTGEITGLGVLRMLEAIRIVTAASPPARPAAASSSTRRRAARCSARCRRPPRTRTRPSTPAAPTASPRSTATTSPSTTARATASSPAAASSSTTSRPAAGPSSSPARSPRAPSASSWASRRSSSSATSTAERDWGFAGDYVRAMHMMLQHARGGRLRHRQRRVPHDQRVRRARLPPPRPRLAGLRPQRPQVHTPGRGRAPLRRRHEGPPEARLAAHRRLQGAGGDDGRV